MTITLEQLLKFNPTHYTLNQGLMGGMTPNESDEVERYAPADLELVNQHISAYDQYAVNRKYPAPGDNVIVKSKTDNKVLKDKCCIATVNEENVELCIHIYKYVWIYSNIGDIPYSISMSGGPFASEIISDLTLLPIKNTLWFNIFDSRGARGGGAIKFPISVLTWELIRDNIYPYKNYPEFKYSYS